MRARERELNSHHRRWGESAGALVELTLFMPVAFLILLGTLSSSELIQSASEASQLSREVGNLALRQCPSLQGTELSNCLSNAAGSVLSLRPTGAREAHALVSLYRCPSFTCADVSGHSCPVLSSTCQCSCPGASVELVGQGPLGGAETFNSRYSPALISQSPHLAALFDIKGFMVISEVRVQYRETAGPLSSLGAYEASFL